MIAAVSAAFVKPDKPAVLCVEDDEIQQRLLKRILEKGGFRVLQATTADEGLRLFRNDAVALVVIDERLGAKQMTGTRLAQEVKARRPNMPVVLRSGYPPENMGNWDVFINKGEPVESFLKIVRDLIKRFAE